jgi:plasmid maintenance system antidote protein VapI
LPPNDKIDFTPVDGEGSPEEKYKQGLIAYSQGKAKEAIDLWTPLAKSGHVKAKSALEKTIAEYQPHPEITDPTPDLITPYKQGLIAYSQDKFKEATDFFTEAAKKGSLKGKNALKRVLAEGTPIAGTLGAEDAPGLRSASESKLSPKPDISFSPLKDTTQVVESKDKNEPINFTQAEPPPKGNPPLSSLWNQVKPYLPSRIEDPKTPEEAVKKVMQNIFPLALGEAVGKLPIPGMSGIKKYIEDKAVQFASLNPEAKNKYVRSLEQAGIEAPAFLAYFAAGGIPEKVSDAAVMAASGPVIKEFSEVIPAFLEKLGPAAKDIAEILKTPLDKASRILIDRDKTVTPEDMFRLSQVGKQPQIKRIIQSKYGLTPAIKAEGQVVPGEFGETHVGISKRLGIDEAADEDRGFMDAKGKWLTREEAAQIVSKIDKRPVGGGKLYTEHLIKRAEDAHQVLMLNHQAQINSRPNPTPEAQREMMLQAKAKQIEAGIKGESPPQNAPKTGSVVGVQGRLPLKNASVPQRPAQNFEFGGVPPTEPPKPPAAACGGGSDLPPPGESYSTNRPFDIEVGPNDKLTAQRIREQFAGIKNEQIVRGNQLADEIKRAVPSEIERQGMFWYKAANGNLQFLAANLDNPKFAEYHPQIQAAMNLSPNAMRMLGKVKQYYTETGAVSKEIGTIGNVIENYQNRLYLPDKPTDFVKTEMKSGIRQSTRHAKQRVFTTEFEAAYHGKRFATTDISDALSIHNEEMARVNTSRKMGTALVDKGLAGWKRDVPDGWAKVGTLEKRVPVKDQAGNAVIGDDGNQVVSTSHLVAPKGIAKGLSAISDPNFTKKIDSLRNLQRYQGLVKTVDLSFSFFHHFSMAMQTLYQGDIFTFKRMPMMNKILAAPEFSGLERDFVLHTGMTAKVEANQDILRNLVQNNEDAFSKIVNLPVVKNVLKTADRSADFLFGKMQRFMKVNSYAGKAANWVRDHPTATNAEVRSAKVGFAQHINAVYGGLNWEAMGMTKSNLSLLRLGMLAPDWTISNMQLLSQGAGGGTAGGASRAHILKALTIGITLTEGLNKILTGHFTDQNKPGHKLEVEISPDVYTSFFRGGIGDIVKLGSMIQESGLGGVSRFAQGKLAPLPRTAVGLLTNTQYTGQPIVKKKAGPVKGTYETLEYLLSSAAPFPLGGSNFLQYLKQGSKVTPQGSAAVLTGVGRYSKPPKNSPPPTPYHADIEFTPAQ